MDGNWSSYLPTALRVPIEVYRNRRFLQHWWTVAQTQLNSGRTGVVVLGRSGAGKSFLTAQMHGVGNQLDWVDPGVSSNVETHPIPLGPWTEIVRVIPGGQSRERAIGMGEAFQNSPGLEGIIYVCCAGFTEIRSPVAASTAVKGGMDTTEKFRQTQMREEEFDLKQVCDRILELQAHNIKPKYFVVAINKLDLFYNDLDAIQNHYDIHGNGSFARILQDFARNADTQSLRIKCIPVSSTMKSFKWNTEVTSSQFDDIELQKNSIRQLLDQLGELSR